MKRNTLMILLVVLVLALTIPGALAQTFPTGGISGIQVVNLDSSSAVVTAAYYAQDGTQYTLQDQTLANQGDTYTYYSEPADASTFSGAAILSADKQIAAVANTAFGNGAGGAYGGSNTGATTVLLPLVTKAYAGGSTAIGVQNTDTANSITAEITFSAQDATKYSGTKTYTLPPGASQIIDLGLDADFEDSWIGSASVSPQDGSTPVVGSALVYTNNYVYAYSGFTATGTEWFLPLARAGFANLSTGIQVVNAGATDVSTTINYTGQIWPDYNAANATDYTCTVTATLPASGSITFYNAPTWPIASVLGASDGQITGGDCQTQNHATFSATGGMFLGSATITTNGEVAVVVNDADASGTTSGAYNGFLASDAAASIISPLARVAFANFTTGTQVQNICGTDVTVSTTYSTSSLSQNTTAPTLADQVIATGSSYTFYVAPGGDNDGWLGSLTASTSDGDCLVGITNDAIGGGDSSVFNTFAMP